ncbi:MAG TPA: Fic family protein [Gemmatimonadaceae bacterium]|nr:Fic family protein [Gemmatimonadaceae bacterium]
MAADTGIPLLSQLDPRRFDSTSILKRVATAGRQLAELKGITVAIPNREVLINTLGLQEAKDSSAIENIVTTHDQLFREASLPEAERSAAGKEVLRYVTALRLGRDAVARTGLLTCNDIVRVQEALDLNQAGFRKLPGTALKNQYGETVYTPPDPQFVVPLMTELERFINQDEMWPVDPLVKMAIAHYQFECIHPFYDGNGRTGRIVNVLYLVKQNLLETPALYMSRYIIQTKGEYYRLLRAVRDADAWEEWVLYMLSAVEATAQEGVIMVAAIRDALLTMKHAMRSRHKRIYSQDLLNLLFAHPYTKIQFVQDELGISRITATKYLDTLAGDGFLDKVRIGRANYYVNPPLVGILTGAAMHGPMGDVA